MSKGSGSDIDHGGGVSEDGGVSGQASGANTKPAPKAADVLKIVDPIASLVTRFPSLSAPLVEFARTVEHAVDERAGLAVAEEQILAATDAIASVGLAEALGAHAPTAAPVDVDGRRYRRLRDATARGVPKLDRGFRPSFSEVGRVVG